MLSNPNSLWTDTKIENSKFTNNYAGESGGAVFVYANKLEIINSDFESNQAYIGGGALAGTQKSEIKISVSTFTLNDAMQNYGGAIYTDNHCSLDIARATFDSNTAGIKEPGGSDSQKNGGAIRMQSADNLAISDSLFTNNSAQSSGGALYLTSSASTILNGDNKFEGNTTVLGSGGAIHTWSSPLFINDNAQFVANTAKTYGGAIGFENSIARTEDEFTVSAGTTFTDNKSGNKGILYLSDMHKNAYEKIIKATVFSKLDDSTTFEQGFNNYDIGPYSGSRMFLVNEDPRVTINLTDMNQKKSFIRGEQYTFEEPKLSEEDAAKFVFVGWEVNGELKKAGEFIYFMDKDITAKAKWSEYKTLTVNANSGIMTENNLEILKKVFLVDDLNVKLSLLQATRAGYELIGWDIDKDAINPTYAVDAEFVLDDNLEIFAIWKRAVFTVSYNANGGKGTVPADKQYGKNTEVSIETASLSKANYKFVGWTIDGKDYKTSDKFIITKDTEIIAKWLKIEESTTSSGGGPGTSTTGGGGPGPGASSESRTTNTTEGKTTVTKTTEGKTSEGSTGTKPGDGGTTSIDDGTGPSAGQTTNSESNEDTSVDNENEYVDSGQSHTKEIVDEDRPGSMSVNKKNPKTGQDREQIYLLPSITLIVIGMAVTLYLNRRREN